MKYIFGLLLLAYSGLGMTSNHLITYNKEAHAVIIYVPAEDSNGWDKHVYLVNKDNVVDPGNPTIDEFVESVFSE